MKRRKLVVATLFFASMFSIAYSSFNELNLLGSNTNRILQKLADKDEFVDAIFLEIIKHDELGTAGMSKVDLANYKQLIVGGIQSVKFQSLFVPLFNRWGGEILNGEDQLVVNTDTIRNMLGTNLPVSAQAAVGENFLTNQQLLFDVAAYSKPLFIINKGLFLAPILWVIWLLVMTLSCNFKFRQILKNVSWQLVLIGTVLTFISILVPSFLWFLSIQIGSGSYVDIAMPIVLSDLLHPTLRVGLIMIISGFCLFIISICINFQFKRGDLSKLAD